MILKTILFENLQVILDPPHLLSHILIIVNNREFCVHVHIMHSACCLAHFTVYEKLNATAIITKTVITIVERI